MDNRARLLTPYHARYYALLLSRRGAGAERYLPALASANIDLHPHQVEAALFASRSPYRDGVILADEEGLGKTVEAGIALLQASIEGRRNLLVLCPPTLVELWRHELVEKFSLACVGLDGDAADPRTDAAGDSRVVLLTYAGAQREAERLAVVAWDLCVLDEAHLLANASLSNHVQANAIRAALQGRPKLLLTATPMQNSVMDLYHLVRFVDETTFPADAEAFRARYTGNKPARAELASRAQQICQRTLRRQALTLPAVRRLVRTILVAPTLAEEVLSKRMSSYFHREQLLAFPKVQEHKIRLTYWKLLASSPRALADSLDRVAQRLEHVPGALDEQTELRCLAGMARDLSPGSRAEVFLPALRDTLQRAADAGAPAKAVVFSENLATLAFLEEYLSANGYAGRIAVFSGDRGGKKVLAAFATGEADILLATDRAGTGLDLSHCAIVINYDLPWNVQKLEQRISRCHRYGQRHDVQVVNFLDPTNRADRRLYDSLNKKLKTFDQVFGASESLLGHVSDGETESDAPRTADQIQADQAAETAERRTHIDTRVGQAEADLLAHFDDVVRERFRQYGETIPRQLEQHDHWLWAITRQALAGKAVFDDADRSFVLDRSPWPDLRLSRITFGMDKARPMAERYRLNHPLAKRVLDYCLDGRLERGRLTLKARGSFAPGQAGEIGFWLAGMASSVAYETHPLLCGYLDGEDDRPLSEEECAGLLKLAVVDYAGGPAEREEGETWRGRTWKSGAGPGETVKPSVLDKRLSVVRDQALAQARAHFVAEQDGLLAAELDRLRDWAKVEEAVLSKRLAEEGKTIAALREKAASSGTFIGQFGLQREALRRQKARRADEEKLARLAAEARRKRDALMDAARARSKARFWERELFVVRFIVADGHAARGKP